MIRPSNIKLLTLQGSRALSVNDGGWYKLSQSPDGATATLSIADVDGESDLGDYKCIANNGKSSGELYVTLRKALAPGPVQVREDNVFMMSEQVYKRITL